jgi:hypothetical protein
VRPPQSPDCISFAFLACPCIRCFYQGKRNSIMLHLNDEEKTYSKTRDAFQFTLPCCVTSAVDCGMQATCSAPRSTLFKYKQWTLAKAEFLGKYRTAWIGHLRLAGLYFAELLRTGGISAHIVSYATCISSFLYSRSFLSARSAPLMDEFSFGISHWRRQARHEAPPAYYWPSLQSCRKLSLPSSQATGR